LFGVFAAVQRNRADNNARKAVQNALVADAGRLAAQARVIGADQVDLSLLLAVQARRLLRSNATDGGLLAALARVPPGVESSVRIPATSGSVALSPDGRLLAIPGTDDRVHLVDAHDWHVIRSLDGFRSGYFGSTAFSADGTMVLGAGDGAITVWHVKTGDSLGPAFQVGNGAVAAVFDPGDASRIFAAADGRVMHLDFSVPARPSGLAEKPYGGLPGVDTLVMHASPDGQLLAVGSFVTKETVVFDLRSFDARSNRPVAVMRGTAGPFTTDGTSLAIARGDRVVLVDARTGAERGSALQGFQLAHPAMIVSSDGRYLAASDFLDREMRVFDLRTRRQVGQSLAVFPGPSFPVAFRDGGRLLTADGGRGLVWRFASRATPLVTPLPEQGPGAVSAQFSPDGSQFITVNQNTHVVRRWRATDGAPLGRMLDDRAAPERPLGFSPDGKVVVTKRRDGPAGLFDVASGAPLSVLDTGQGETLKTVWSPVEPIVALGSDDQSLTLWDVSDPRRPRLRTRVQTAAKTDFYQPMIPGFSPDGRKVIAVSTLAGTVVVYDVATGNEVRTLHTPIQSPIAFTPDGTSVIIAHRSGGLEIVDVTTGRTRTVFENAASPSDVRFIANGTRLLFEMSPLLGPSYLLPLIVGGSAVRRADTASIALYDARTLEPIGEPIAVPGTIPFISGLSPDGTRFVTGATDLPGAAPALWDLDPDRWQATACKIAGRNLTRNEWRQYLPGRAYEKTCARWPSASV
jgi:WD40 repeat protein